MGVNGRVCGLRSYPCGVLVYSEGIRGAGDVEVDVPIPAPLRNSGLFATWYSLHIARSFFPQRY